jgi:hypothetical protein
VTSREKMLTGAVAAAGVLWFGTQGLTRYRDAVQRNTSQQLEAEQALSEANTAVIRGQNARRQLNKWVSQSLPSNREVAKSLYQDWLRSQLTGAGLEVTQLSDKSGSSRNAQFTELATEIRGAGTLAQVADFLYRFYTAPHLHRISGATVTAADGGKKLNLVLTVNALILPDAKRTDRLAEGEPRKLGGTMEEFRDRLVGRNLFAAYTPKSDGKAAEAQKDEVAGKTKVTGMAYGLEGWLMSVRTEGSGDVKYFKHGDKIEFGKVKGTVVEVDGRRAVIETDKGRLEIRLGQSFAEAVPIEAPAAQAPNGPSPASSQTSPAPA